MDRHVHQPNPEQIAHYKDTNTETNKRMNGIIFDNAQGCYDRIISGISLTTVMRLGYSKHSVRMLGKLLEQLEHHISMG
jgi:hypothetical protein